jgi:hypothetical protein
MSVFGHFVETRAVFGKMRKSGGFLRQPSGHPFGGHAFVFFVVLAALLPLLPGETAAQVHNPDAVKAAFVYNLTKYVEWRETRDELIIGFVGSGPMGRHLSSLAGKTSESRVIYVVEFPSEEAIGNCDILFVGAISAKSRRGLLQKVQAKGILTVSDEASFTREGGMVGLVTVGDHVQLEINLGAVQAAHLKISSRLLTVAVLVNPQAAERR